MNKIINRLFGLILLFSGVVIFGIPFIIIFIFNGVDKSNVFMSKMMRIPMNMISGDDKIGDFLLKMHLDELLDK